MGARPPLVRLPRERLIAQVPDRDLRPHGGASTGIEMNQALRYGISRRSAVEHNQVVGHLHRAQPLALESQERDLLRWIEPTQVRVELETIDHAGRGAAAAEKYVLRT